MTAAGLAEQVERLAEQVERLGLALPGSPVCSRPRQWGRLLLGGSAPSVAVATTAPEPALAGVQAVTAARAGADLVELRLDLLKRQETEGDGPGRATPSSLASLYLEATVQVASALEAEVLSVPLLLTVRSAGEGGGLAVTDPEYEAVLAALVDGVAQAPGVATAVAAVDVELARGCVPAVAARAHRAGVDVVASAHFFDRTPPRGEIAGLAAAMQAAGADVVKVAVMPRQDSDVFTLLAATAQARVELDAPLVTMSMGEPGVVTRLGGASFGSALSFATAGGQASAPGQPPIQAVRQAWAELGVR